MPASNLRNKHPGLTIDGVTKSYRQWGKETGLSPTVVWTREKVLGWTGKKLLSPIRFWNVPEINEKLSKERMGSKNPMWKGGATPEKSAAYQRQWNKEHESSIRDKKYRERYGLTLEEYDRMFEKQNGLCAICGKTCKRGRLSVDHCHKTGKIRGLLCRKCNVLLGFMNDDTNWLKKAEVYLACQE